MRGAVRAGSAGQCDGWAQRGSSVTDIPRRTAARTAKLASLPLGVAGRAAAGWGRRLVGGNSERSPRR